MRSTAALAVAFSALVLLVGVISATAYEDMDILLPSGGNNGRGKKGGKPWDCCDNCLCTRSQPPQCQCTDMLKDECHPNCEKCICTLSIPAQCRCLDVIHEPCGPRCSPEERRA